MPDSPRTRFHLPRWGWFLLATVILVAGIVDLSVWLPYNSSMEKGSPFIVAALGIIVAAFGIWLTVRLVNRGKIPSARFCVCVVLVIAFGALSIWLPSYREQQVIQMIEARGGSASTERLGPYWLRWLVGKDRMKVFDRVRWVGLESSTNTDAVLARLSGLTNLKFISLDGTMLTDAGLAHLSGLPNLNELYLKGTTVTDDELPKLSRLTNLKVVWLDGTAVTDLGPAHLSGLKNLEFLILNNSTAVTDEGVEELQKALPHCHIHRERRIVPRPFPGS